LRKKLFILITFFLNIYLTLNAQQPTTSWDSIKATTTPVVAPAFANDFEAPYRQPLSAYGWEDGIHISRDGLHLYALYYSGDLYSWTVFFLNNLNILTPCELLGNTAFFRPYAETFGMDLTTNVFACDTFINVDILYAHRPNITDSFTQWQLSGIARPGAPEGGPYPLFSQSNPNVVDIFLFTATSDIWMIRNTTANPYGIANAVRLPFPINPVTDEFSADNPHLERINGDTLLLIYEKYTNLGQRDFVYAFSYDDGYTWTNPIPMTTISPTLGHIEHPHLYKNLQGQWYMYFSIDCEIYRAVQGQAGDWDSWQNIELVIGRGNSPCIGEPSLTAHGDISFAVAYHNPLLDSTDAYDIDPWFLPVKITNTAKLNTFPKSLLVCPNPVSDNLWIEIENPSHAGIALFDINGRQINVNSIISDNHIKIDLSPLESGVYIIRIFTANQNYMARVIVLKH